MRRERKRGQSGAGQCMGRRPASVPVLLFPVFGGGMRAVRSRAVRAFRAELFRTMRGKTARRLTDVVEMFMKLRYN